MPCELQGDATYFAGVQKRGTMLVALVGAASRLWRCEIGQKEKHEHICKYNNLLVVSQILLWQAGCLCFFGLSSWVPSGATHSMHKTSSINESRSLDAIVAQLFWRVWCEPPILPGVNCVLQAFANLLVGSVSQLAQRSGELLHLQFGSFSTQVGQKPAEMVDHRVGEGGPPRYICQMENLEQLQTILNIKRTKQSC